MKVSKIICLSLAFLVCGCSLFTDSIDPTKITSINIIDRNGLSETISSKERLEGFDQTNFLGPQPYQKVMRVYGKEKNGDVRAQITSYHPNGQIKQYLEALNNRAYGTYREWFSNGQLKIFATIIGGTADLNTQAEESWLFDGINYAWDEEGHCIATIPYSKGELEGEALYYHPNGTLWKSSPYAKNKLHGIQKTYLLDGTLLQTTEYVGGLKEGLSLRYWNPDQIAYQERYHEGKLLEALYYDTQGKQISQISHGNGFKAILSKEGLQELQEFKHGVQEGKVSVFDQQQHVVRTFAIKNGKKEGEEIEYYPATVQPKLLLTWSAGVLQGPVKTWYDNGSLESEREMSHNQKNGLLTAWYRKGALMLVEEYDNDKLVKGEYYRMGEKAPASTIERGRGVATLFNAEGHFHQKIHYQEGRPIE